jgi:hypothetical protein
MRKVKTGAGFSELLLKPALRGATIQPFLSVDLPPAWGRGGERPKKSKQGPIEDRGPSSPGDEAEATPWR